MDSAALLAGAPFVGLGLLYLAYAWRTGRLADGYRSVFVTRDLPAASPTPQDRAAELVRIASHGGVVVGFDDVSVERVPNGYRVAAGRVAVIYPSPANAERAITQWLTR